MKRLLVAALLAFLLTLRLPALADGPAPYLLSPDDQFSISVLGHDEYKAEVTIGPDGAFNYPLVGTVHAAGKTAASLTVFLTRVLSDQLNQPQVTLTMRQSRPRRVSILGAVKSPGVYDWHPGWHLLDALAVCGGFGQATELTQATLVPVGGQKSVPIDVGPLMAGLAASQNLPLSPGDVLLVQARDPALAQAQVIGEVARPGLYTVPPEGASALALLTLAGGATAKGALSQAQILHAGTLRVCNLRVWMEHLDSETKTLRLMAGDVLLIPANVSHIAVLGEVRTPGIFDVPDGGHLTLLDVMALAGGLNSDADRKNVRIVRRNTQGQPVSASIDFDGLLRGNPNATDAPLLPGDLLLIPSKKTNANLTLASVLSYLPLVSLLKR